MRIDSGPRAKKVAMEAAEPEERPSLVVLVLERQVRTQDVIAQSLQQLESLLIQHPLQSWIP